MTNVAQLGIDVSIKGASQASGELQKLTNSAKAAEAAVKSLTAQKGAAGAALAAAKGYQQQSAAALAAAKASETASRADISAAQAALAKARAVTASAKADYDSVSASLAVARADEQQAAAALRAASAANTNNAAMVKTYNTSNIAAQGFDVLVTSMAGMPPHLIAMQQGLQLAQVAMTSTGGFLKTLGSAFVAMLSPVTLLIVAFTGLAAAGLQMVNWTAVLGTALQYLGSALQTIAPYAAAAAATLALMYAPALIAGLASVAVGVYSLATALGALAIRATAAWIAMTGPWGWIIAGIAAVLAAVVIFDKEITEVLGFSIADAAKTGVNAIIGIFVGAYKTILATWKLLPSAIGDVVVSAANATIQGVENMINKAIKGINDLVSAAYSAANSLAASVGLSGFGAAPTIGGGGVSLGTISNPFKGAGNQFQKEAGSAFENAMGVDYVGEIAKGVTTAVNTAGEAVKNLGTEFSKTAAEAEKAGGKGKKAGEDTTEGMDKAAKAAAKAAKEVMQFARDVVGGFVSDLRQGLKNGESFWDAFANAAMNALDKITDKLINQVLDALFQVNNAGGGGGWLASIFGGGFSNQWNQAAAGALVPGLYAKGGTFPGGINAHSNSVVNRPTMFAFAKGAGLMGEAGPEAVMPLSRDGSGRLGVNVVGGTQMAQNAPVQVNIINNNGSKVTQQERSNDAGGKSLDVFIDEMVSSKMATPGSNINQTMQKNFNLGGGLAKR